MLSNQFRPQQIGNLLLRKVVKSLESHIFSSPPQLCQQPKNSAVLEIKP
jgi:hypothetical protein